MQTGDAEYQREWKRRHPGAMRRYRLRHYYGLGSLGYARLVADQGGVCALCGRPPSDGKPLCVDHDHVTGRIRGLLCTNCNTGLGKFFDDADVLRQAAQYIAAADTGYLARGRPRPADAPDGPTLF